MVEQGAGEVVLSGRRSPEGEGRRWLDEIAASGASVRYEALDVADAGAVSRLALGLARAPRPLAGVVHAAGLLDDATIPGLDPSRLAAVFRPKAEGAAQLDRALRGRPLDFVVHFSSMAGLLGSAGQANYAAANAFLDSLAVLQRSRGTPALSVQWGPWKEAGMAADLDQGYRARYARMGLEAIGPEDGVEMFGRLLSTDLAQAGVFRIDARCLLDSPSWRRLASYLEPLAGGPSPPSAAVPADDILDRVRAAASKDRPAILTAWLTGEIARVLGMAAGSTPEPEDDMARLGVDSLMAAELRQVLQTRLATEIKAASLFEHRTIAELGAYLAHLLFPSG